VLILSVAWILPIESLPWRVVCKLALAAVFVVGILKLGVLLPEEAGVLKEVVRAGRRKLGWVSLGVAAPRN